MEHSETCDLDRTNPIRYWAGKTPDKIAISTADISLSYAELDERVDRCAAFLADHGVTEYQSCAIDTSDRLFFVICWFALFRLRVASLSFAPDTPGPRKESVARKCDLGAVISDSGHAVPGTRLIPANMQKILDHPYDPNRSRPRGTSDYVMLITGSGTTGTPKIIAVSFAALNAATPNEAAAWNFHASDVVAATVNPWTSSTPFRIHYVFDQGARFHVFSGTSMNLFDSMEQAGVTKIIAAVVHGEKMIKLGQQLNRRLPGEARIILYASVVTDGLIQRIKDQLTNNISILYGTNEVGILTSIDLSTDSRPTGSVGRVVDGAQVEIVDASDAPVAIGERGHLRARAPRLFSEYIGEEEETNRAIRNGWFYPADIAKIDPQGNVVLLGRSDHVMIFDGLNIHPAEIETVMSKHPAVIDVAVIPFKHETHQDVPICAITTSDDANVTGKEMFAYAKDQLGSSVPAHIVILDEIPRNESGKVVRKDLAARIAVKMGWRK